jgi:hypothetical protein
MFSRKTLEGRCVMEGGKFEGGGTVEAFEGGGGSVSEL